MIRTAFVLIACMVCTLAKTQSLSLADPDKGITHYTIPDTTRGIVFYNEVIMRAGANPANSKFTVIGFSRGSLAFVQRGAGKTIVMQMSDSSGSSEYIATGVGVTVFSTETRSWSYAWKPGVVYKTMLTALPDSATRTTIYAAYVFLPEKRQWKMIATAKCTNDGDYLRGIYAIHRNEIRTGNKPGNDTISISNAWLQRRNGSWYAFQSQRPLIDLAKNTDSTAQARLDKEAIYAAVRNKQIDTTGSKEGVYYHVLKQGTGEPVSVTDTVTVFYKGFLLSNGLIFDQTKEKPATFPLKRLIRGWQIAIPMCRVGGTVRVIIPSGQAYGIRARSKDIPPNSVLVFDVEIVSAKKQTDQ